MRRVEWRATSCQPTAGPLSPGRGNDAERCDYHARSSRDKVIGCLAGSQASDVEASEESMEEEMYILR